MQLKLTNTHFLTKNSNLSSPPTNKETIYKLPSSIPVINHNLPLLSPKFFTGKSIYISLSNHEYTQALTYTLKLAGASFVDEHSAEIVIIEKPTRDIFLGNRSRGSKLAKSVGPSISPKRKVTLEEIPWALELKKSEKETDVVPAIVIVDQFGANRPKYKVMKEMPIIFDDRVIRGYTISPFTPIPKDQEGTVGKLMDFIAREPKLKSSGLSEEGYCEICGFSFKDGNQHRNSPEHRRNAGNPNLWKEFDRLCIELKYKM